MGEGGIRSLLKRSKPITKTSVAWSIRWAQIKCHEDDPSCNPIGYILKCLRQGVEEPPTDQELNWTPPVRTPTPPPPVDVEKLRAESDKLPAADRQQFWKQRRADPNVVPLISDDVMAALRSNVKEASDAAL
jgi:hypothetical protein